MVQSRKKKKFGILGASRDKATLAEGRIRICLFTTIRLYIGPEHHGSKDILQRQGREYVHIFVFSVLRSCKQALFRIQFCYSGLV